MIASTIDQIVTALRALPKRAKDIGRSALAVACLVIVAYGAGFRYERAILVIQPLGSARGDVVVNRLAQTDSRARLGLQGSYSVHPRDFEASFYVVEGAVSAEYVVYRGNRAVRRVSGSVAAGERQVLVLSGGAFVARSRLEPWGS